MAAKAKQIEMKAAAYSLDKEYIPPTMLGVQEREAKQKMLHARLAHNLHFKQTGFIQIAWGDGLNFNAIPQIAEDALLNNAGATVAIKKLAEYACGNGFTNKEYNDLSVSDDTEKGTRHYFNIRIFLKEVAMNAVFYGGAFAFRILRNPETGRICLIKPLNLGNNRIGRCDDGYRIFRYNEFTNRLNYTYGHDEFLPEYNPELTLQEVQDLIALQKATHKRYVGECYYHYIEEPGAPYCRAVPPQQGRRSKA